MSLANESWPFHDHISGLSIQEEMYYGFLEAGGCATHYPYFTAEACLEAMLKLGYDCRQLSTDPNQLGEATVCVLSGRQFIDQLKALDDLAVFGDWS